jgi:hypothetical protein
MEEQRLISTTPSTLAAPAIYAIRVRGLLPGQPWVDSYDGAQVAADERSGETILLIPLPDQAALYGLLSRLRNLGLPLISINAVETTPGIEGAGRSGRRLTWGERLKRIRWGLILAFLLLTGGLSALTVLLTATYGVHAALALTGLFAAEGGLALGLGQAGGGRGWRALTGVFWLAAIITLTVLVTATGWIPTALALALWGLGVGGAVLRLSLGRRAAPRPLREGVTWEPLGNRAPESQANPPPDRDR